MMAEVNVNCRNTHRVRRSNNKLSTKVDLTPMVDLGFLLITFFVFTTTMAEAKALNITFPVDGKPRPVAESGTMSIILGNDHIYYYHGLLGDMPGKATMKTANLSNIRKSILAHKRNTEIGKLLYIIKAEDSSTYGDNINLLDEMAICHIAPGHYVEAEIDEKESGMIQRIRKSN